MHVIQVKLQSLLKCYASNSHVYTSFVTKSLWITPLLFLTAILPGYEKGQQQDATEFLNSLVSEVGKDRYCLAGVCMWLDYNSVALYHTPDCQAHWRSLSR